MALVPVELWSPNIHNKGGAGLLYPQFLTITGQLRYSKVNPSELIVAIKSYKEFLTAIRDGTTRLLASAKDDLADMKAPLPTSEFTKNLLHITPRQPSTIMEHEHLHADRWPRGNASTHSRDHQTGITRPRDGSQQLRIDMFSGPRVNAAKDRKYSDFLTKDVLAFFLQQCQVRPSCYVQYTSGAFLISGSGDLHLVKSSSATQRKLQMLTVFLLQASCNPQAKPGTTPPGAAFRVVEIDERQFARTSRCGSALCLALTGPANHNGAQCSRVDGPGDMDVGSKYAKANCR